MLNISKKNSFCESPFLLLKVEKFDVLKHSLIKEVQRIFTASTTQRLDFEICWTQSLYFSFEWYRIMWFIQVIGRFDINTFMSLFTNNIQKPMLSLWDSFHNYFEYIYKSCKLKSSKITLNKWYHWVFWQEIYIKSLFYLFLIAKVTFIGHFFRYNLQGHTRCLRILSSW